MGVHGLWKLLEPAGKAVALESLQNKILGVDVSIWLHQAMKGFQDRKGSPVPNAHLLGIFHRVCKLLFYRIKPVFVFDGGVPILKKNTIAARRKFKGQAARDAKQVAEKLLRNLVKHKAVRKVLGEKASRNAVSDDRPRNDENLFELPPMLNDLNDYENLSSDSEASVKYEPSGEESDSDQDVKYLSPSKVYAMNLDLHTLDVTSENFRSLPADVRHDILSDLKETRKQSSWGRLHEMPKESTDFSSFQLNRLLKRRTVQVSLEEAEKEMGGKVLSMAELEDIMSAQGVKLEDGLASSKEYQLNAYSKRIASDVATRFLLLSESTRNKELTTDSIADTKKELKKEDRTEKSDGKVKIKQEHQDNWSSDESVKEMKVEKKLDEVKIKQEYEDDWSSEDEGRKIPESENLAEQFINDKDSLSQAEILALIQNEKKRDTDDDDDTQVDAPSTSRATGSSVKVNITGPSTSKIALEPLTSKADIVEVPTGTKTSSKNKVEVQTRDSPVTVKSDSENDFDEVLPIEPEIIEKVISIRHTGQVKKQNIEVVIDKNQSYKPEDDIFADIFPVSEAPKEVLQLTPEKINTQPERTVMTNVNEKQETPTKTGGLQEMVERFVREKVEIEQKKAQRTPDKVVNLNGKDETVNDVVITEKDGQEQLGNPEIEIQQPSKALIPQMSSEDLKSLESELEGKHEELLAEKGRQERLAASITDQMCAEAQELLRLFGVPYVVAPMEAEAQCAFMDALSLTEGTITDDSDIWLFGGNKVYKNFFNQKKHVLQYTATTIQHYLKLERTHLILLALLVGSDYTTGIRGIGPVTAMEVLAAFPPGKVNNMAENRDALIEGLRRFRDWWQAGRPQRSAATQQLRNKVKDVQFYEGFPSLAVVDAYLRPAVDESKEAFSWGDLDLQGLREFARMKFGWAQAKVDEILLPVAKRVAERKNQRFIDSYFNAVPQYQEGDKKMSKRVKKAVRRMGNEESDNEDVDDPEPKSRKRSASEGGVARKRRAKTGGSESEDVDDPAPKSRKRSASQSGAVRKKRANDSDKAVSGEEDEAPEPRQRNSGPRQRVKRVKEQDTVTDEDDSTEPKKSRPARSEIKAKPKNKEGDDLPKPRPRQRTSTGVVRTGAKGPQKKIVTGNEGTDLLEDEKVKKPVTKVVRAPRKKATNTENNSLEPSEETVRKVVNRIEPRRETTNVEETRSLNTINEDDETPLPPEDSTHEPSAEPKPSTSVNSLQVSEEFEPMPGTSKDCDTINDPDEEEEAILAALHAMDWEDDPWGGFEPPREKLFFGGVRKNPTKPRRPPQPPPPPPPSAQPVDTRGYRPGTRTLDRIESRVTQPQLEWNTPSNKIPQKERDRQLAEDSKMKAIKLFKAAGAIKKSKLLGEDPASSKRKPKKKKPVAKVKELDLSEESSDD